MMCLLHMKSEGRSCCCTAVLVDEFRLLSLTSNHNRRAEKSPTGRMGGGDWHLIARHLLSVKKSRVKTKDIHLPCFSGIVVSWLCLEACLAAFESAVILFLAA